MKTTEKNKIKNDLFMSGHGNKAHFVNKSDEYICHIETPDKLYPSSSMYYVGSFISSKSDICSYCDDLVSDKRQVLLLRGTDVFRELFPTGCYDHLIVNPETEPTISGGWTDGKPFLHEEISKERCETCDGYGTLPNEDTKCQSCEGTGEVLPDVATMTKTQAKKAWLDYIIQFLNKQTDEDGLLSYYPDRPDEDIETLIEVLEEFQDEFNKRLDKLK